MEGCVKQDDAEKTLQIEAGYHQHAGVRPWPP